MQQYIEREFKDVSKTTLQLRLYPTPEQARLLLAHCQEYISTVNVLVAAFDSDVLTGNVSTKDFTASLPRAVKNQALRDAQSVFKRSFELERLPLLKKPMCQWNNQNWRIAQGWPNLLLAETGKRSRYAFDVPMCPSKEKPGRCASSANGASG